MDLPLTILLCVFDDLILMKKPIKCFYKLNTSIRFLKTNCHLCNLTGAKICHWAKRMVPLDGCQCQTVSIQKLLPQTICMWTTSAHKIMTEYQSCQLRHKLVTLYVKRRDRTCNTLSPNYNQLLPTKSRFECKSGPCWCRWKRWRCCWLTSRCVEDISCSCFVGTVLDPTSPPGHSR